MGQRIFQLRLSVIIHSAAASISRNRKNREAHLAQVVSDCEELQRLGVEYIIP